MLNSFPAIIRKQGRVAALAHDSGVAVEKLRHESENAEYLDKLFVQYGVVEP